MSKILIVEDEESIAELEKDYLELSGFEVEIENNGTDGLERAKKLERRKVERFGVPLDGDFCECGPDYFHGIRFDIYR